MHNTKYRIITDDDANGVNKMQRSFEDFGMKFTNTESCNIFEFKTEKDWLKAVRFVIKYIKDWKTLEIIKDND